MGILLSGRANVPSTSMTSSNLKNPFVPEFEGTETGWSQSISFNWKIKIHIQEIAENALDSPVCQMCGSLPAFEENATKQKATNASISTRLPRQS